MIVHVSSVEPDLTVTLIVAVAVVVLCSALLAAYPPEDERSLRGALRRFLRRPAGRVEFGLIVTGLVIAAQVVLHALLGGGL